MATSFLMMLVALMLIQAKGQETPYKYSVGAQVGMSGYQGDASSAMFNHPGFTAGVDMRYHYDSRWMFGGTLAMQTLSGNTADMENVLPEAAQYSFKSSVYDLTARADFNFLPYGMGETYKKLRRWTPYLTLGVGVCLASSEGATAVAPTLPMGFGFRYKPSQRINLNIEALFIKAFSDKIDGPVLNDLTQIKSSFIKNNDWYARITIGISYEFGKRCETCHYVD